MKKFFSLKARSRAFLFLFMTAGFSLSVFSQADTLHLVYHHTQIVPHDSTSAKIDAWVKKLGGKHVDIDVVAYFHKAEFRKFSQQRADELFLVLNRKARALITINFIGPKKGNDSQRTTVDIIYKPTVSPEVAAAEAAKAKADAEAAKATEKQKKDDEKKAAAAEKSAKEKDKPAKENKESDAKKDKSDVAKEKSSKKDEGKDVKSSKGKKDDDEDEDDADYGQASSRSLGEGYTMTLEELKYVKAAKFVVAQTGRKSLDTKLNDAVKSFWNYTSNVVQMPYAEARKIGKENKKDTSVIFSFIQVSTLFTEKHGPVTLKIRRVGYALAIETGKGKLLVKQFIPKVKGQEPSNVDFAFGVAYLNDICRIMDENKLAKSTRVDEFIDLRTPELKNKTLYLAESQVNKNLPKEEIPTYYSSSYNIVSDKDWEEAVLQKKDVAYALVVLFPTNPKHFFHYILDAKTGRIYFVDLNQKISITAGWGTPSFDPTQSGFIDKSNLQRYDKGINNAIKDNQERADDKAKADEKAKEKAAKKEKEAEAKKAKELEKEEKAKAKEKK